MKFKQYLEEIKSSTNGDDLFKLNHDAISDDDINQNEFGQLKQAIDKRKTELNVAQYTAGSRLRHDE